MKATIKTVQVHFECACGLNEVSQYETANTFRDFAKAQGFKKVKNKKTNEVFILQSVKGSICKCYD
jgi:hypothetical protein